VRRIFLIAIITALLGGLVAWQMSKNLGYVLLSYGNYSIDMSLWTFFLIITILAVFFVVLRSLIRFFFVSRKIYSKPQIISEDSRHD